MRNKGRAPLIAIALACFVGQGALSHFNIQPFWQQHYAPKSQGIAEGLSPDQLLAALAGFREMIAGILWVRADSFFDTGNYDAILPIIRLVTWLDPKQLDVYATGMWHIGYNFTDQEQRSDRRYLPSALALGMEGAKNNSNTYEMFFETGWMWYHKIDDNYDKSVRWFSEAIERKDMLPARKNLLSNALQRNGEVDKALNYYFTLLDQAQKDLTETEKMAEGGAFGVRQNRDTLENNIDTMVVRMSQRGWFDKGSPSGLATNYDTFPQFDVGFSVKMTVVEARVLQFEGTWNVLPVGTRIRVILRDADYQNAREGTVDWDKDATSVNLDPPRDATYMQDQLYVRNQRFNKKVNMAPDPTQYPLTKEKYFVEFYYNPRSAPPHIQDKFSWNGEGFTDKNFLNTNIRPGQRVMYTRFEVTRDELLRRGDWRDKVPSRMTANFLGNDRNQELNKDLIQVPSLLDQPSK